MEQHTPCSSVGELCALDGDCFALPEDTSAAERLHTATGGEGETDEDEQQRLNSMHSEPTHSIGASSNPPPPPAANSSASAVTVMQALMSSLTALRLHDLAGVFPTGNKPAMYDDQLRQHAALSSIIPLVDVVHALPSSAALGLSFGRPSAESLSPAALPVELF